MQFEEKNTMRKIPETPWFLGLDIGTNSVGWAVTDQNYQILKRKHKALWGVRLFEEGQVAESRRIQRINRRRLARRKWRLAQLEALFASEIATVDPAFFQRLRDSKYWQEDKADSSTVNVLFNDKAYQDTDYHKAYPTIYHLRYALLSGTAPVDIRLLFLALHNIVKKRGHFLSPGLDPANCGASLGASFKSCAQALRDLPVAQEEPLSDMYESLACAIETLPLDRVQEIVTKKISLSEKEECLLKLLTVTRENKKLYTAFFKLLLGLKGSLSDLLSDEELKDLSKDFTLSKDLAEVEAEKSDLVDALGERYDLLVLMKSLHDTILLVNLMAGYRYFSMARIATYDQHKKDLKTLKEVIKALHDANKIDERTSKMLFSPVPPLQKDAKSKNGETVLIVEKNNYLCYVGHTVNDIPFTACSQEDFCKNLTGFFKPFSADDLPENLRNHFKDMMLRVVAGTFMPKPVSKENATVPYQLHEVELKKILENAETHYPFLKKCDDSGLSISKKICEIFAFRVPYFVGPLNVHSTYAWLKRTNEKITPWNLDQVVDFEASAEGFMRKLTNKCTYLPMEDVLPKDSIIYGKFMVLNALNTLGIRGNRMVITPEMKQRIYKELYLDRVGSVSKAKIVRVIKTMNPDLSDIEEEDLTGIDNEIPVKFKAYHDMCDLWKKAGRVFDIDNSRDVDQAERLIHDILIFGAGDPRAQKILKQRLERVGAWTNEQIKMAVSLKYVDWGHLSRKFLTGITAPGVMNQPTTILERMWEDNCNLMEINSEYRKAIDEENSSLPSQTLRERIEGLYVSPAVRRAIFQTMAIVNELTKVIGCAPAKVFLEMARDVRKNAKGKGKRTISRKQQIRDLYNHLTGELQKDANAFWKESLEARSEDAFKSDKLFLYCLQLGKCAYCGEPIKLDVLLSGSKEYDIDHIYPQSVIKDDSLNNRVLTCRHCNGVKTNCYPIVSDVINKMQPMWQLWNKLYLMSDEKYYRLTRTTRLTEDEVNTFVNRQIVEMRQSTKAIKELLEQALFANEKTIVVCSKSGPVSQFRNGDNAIVLGDKNSGTVFPKSRSINDYHHAKDAYLNIVVGNVLHTKFTQQFIQRILSGDKKASMNWLYADDVEGAWYLAEHPAIGGNKWLPPSMETVKRSMARNDILFTRITQIKTSGNKCGFYKQQIVSKGNDDLIPIKSGDKHLLDTTKYGGYQKPTASFFTLVEHFKGKRRIRTLVPIDLINADSYKKDPIQFLTRHEGLVDPKTIISIVPFDAMIISNGFPAHISAKTGSNIRCKKAIQCVLSDRLVVLSKQIEKICEAGVFYESKTKNEIFPDEEAQWIFTVHGIRPTVDQIHAALLDFYDAFYKKLDIPPYNIKWANLQDKRPGERKNFVDLTILGKCRYLKEAIVFLGCSATLPAAKVLPTAGVVDITQNISELTLVSQSVTGIFERHIDLATCKPQV